MDERGEGGGERGKGCGEGIWKRGKRRSLGVRCLVVNT